MSAKILVADDEANIQAMVKLCLTANGYEVSVASDGLQALEILTRKEHDLLVLDLSMPVMDGMAVLRELPKRCPNSKPGVVVMTAHGSVRTVMEAVRLGASDFLEKPVAPQDLCQSVASLLAAGRFPGQGVVANYDEVLAGVRHALGGGRLGDAESLLMTAGTISDNDPCFMNLAGVIHEVHGRPQSARRFYQKSLAADSAYQPARQNLARHDEIDRTGQSHIPVALGEESAVLELSEPPKPS